MLKRMGIRELEERKLWQSQRITLTLYLFLINVYNDFHRIRLKENSNLLSQARVKISFFKFAILKK